MTFAPGDTLVIAHRGASIAAPDNSLQAFDAAVHAGADMVEFDVRRTRDGVLAVVHDAVVHGLRVDASDFDSLRTASGGTLERLEAVTDLLVGRIGLDVELKEAGYEAAVLDQVRRLWEPEQLCVTSFRDTAVRTVRELAPELQAGLLLGTAWSWRRARVTASELIPRARLRRSLATAVAPHHRLGRHPIFRAALPADQPMFVWTANAPELITSLLDDPRVRGIITDDPATAHRLRAARM